MESQIELQLDRCNADTRFQLTDRVRFDLALHDH
jgi:hypothetical protein